MNRSCLHK